jgi:hypothetical protein
MGNTPCIHRQERSATRTEDSQVTEIGDGPSLHEPVSSLRTGPSCEHDEAIGCVQVVGLGCIAGGSLGENQDGGIQGRRPRWC